MPRYMYLGNLKHNKLRGESPGNCHGFTSWLSLQGGGYSWELLDKKSKSLLFPGAMGAVVTNDWCIIYFRCYWTGLMMFWLMIESLLRI